MSGAASYRIETLSYSSTRLVWLGDVKVAILFAPADEGAPYQLYPHPATFPTLTFEGLPAPLQPEFMSFPDLQAVEAFLGIESQEETTETVAKAA